MAKEFDLIGLASAGGWLKWRRKHADIPPGTPCSNCGTELAGAYCHTCGQLAENFHKSIWHLFMEVLESFFHFDGRLWRTLPPLIYKPGELTHNFINGKRAYQVPPFRLFLVVLVIVFIAGQYGMAGQGDGSDPVSTGIVRTNVNGVSMGSEDAREQARQEIMNDSAMSEAEKRQAIAAVNGDWSTFGKDLARSIKEKSDTAQRERAAQGRPTLPVGVTPAAKPENAVRTGNDALIIDDDAELKLGGAEKDERVQKWFNERIEAVQDDPKRFAMVLENWAHRVAVLALPVSALIMTLLFAFQRRFYVYDHLIFSMHSLSFQLLLLCVLWPLSRWLGGGVWWLLWLSPVHLFMHMRGTYQTSWWGTLLRMAVLFFLTVIAFSGLVILLFYLGFNEMGSH